MKHLQIPSAPSPLPSEALGASNAAAVRQCDGGAMPTQDGVVPTHGGVVPTCACMAGMGVAGVAATSVHQVSCGHNSTAFLCICRDLAQLVLRGFPLAACCGNLLYTAPNLVLMLSCCLLDQFVQLTIGVTLCSWLW